MECKIGRKFSLIHWMNRIFAMFDEKFKKNSKDYKEFDRNLLDLNVQIHCLLEYKDIQPDL